MYASGILIRYSNYLRQKTRLYYRRKSGMLLPGTIVNRDFRYNHILYNVVDQVIKNEEMIAYA
jgi:hypothetical protein